MRLKNQSGSALVVAIFVIVVLGLLVATLSRLTVSSSDSVVTEVLGARAYNAAQTGLNIAMMEVFPLGQPSFDAISDCDDLTLANPITFSAAQDPGLAQCTAVIQCNDVSFRGDVYFQLQANGVCSAGGSQASRSLSIEVTGL
ncbi:Type II secretory pathway component [Idiomarina sp.]|uniref:Type II secretory pathway component n=1 Tax=Idiomarina sp. TaxID=1874361 RepID=UPI0025C204CF|nr:Type II secretory pathway component [Idiomarina sp.]